ncbi:TetR/AcrR family transcriptional regulator [Nocardia sp. NPDC056000]|uniref:TetR/AcrR family transcriptional regulator n=1 Tax=Nocardia sp. NPDC056000 TaxID=3345674 RepID=UPI0035D682AE
MGGRKVLTRAESQARTRENLLDAAEELFFTRGYHATSIATIAAAAGRTIGALYSNFDNKEALCLEVIQRGLAREVAKLMPALMAAPEDAHARMDVLTRWWASSSANNPLLALGAEYLISILRDAHQRATTAQAIERFVAAGRVPLEDFLPEDIPTTGPAAEAAIRAIAATGAGLAIGSAAEVITAEESAQLLGDTVELWIRRVRDTLQPPSGD